jgi:hypothetical protein
MSDNQELIHEGEEAPEPENLSPGNITPGSTEGGNDPKPSDNKAESSDVVV